MISSNMIRNFPVTPTYINTAHKIFGCDVSTLKRKNVRKQTPPVISDYVAIPNQIREMTRRLTVAAGVMFFIWLALVVSVSRRLKFTTVEYMPHRTSPVLSQSLEKIYEIYSKRGFIVELFLIDLGSLSDCGRPFQGHWSWIQLPLTNMYQTLSSRYGC